MHKKTLVVLTIILIGSIFLIGGVGASLNAASAKASCEACGMIVEKTDISTLKVVSADNSEHWACCPICAEVVGLYYGNAEIDAQCYVTGNPITISVVNSNFSSVTSTHGNDVVVVVGGSCKTNKIVASQSEAQQVKQTYDWASNASIKTVAQSFVAARTKLDQMTVGYKPVELPAINYVLIGVGVALFAVAPVTWKLWKNGQRAGGVA